MLDLDGVVYIDGHAVDGVPEHLERLRASGAHVAFVTNNASRTPETVAAKLGEMGIRAEATDVVTSAQAAASLLADRFGSGARVLALGGPGLVSALREAGLEPVTDPEAPGIAALATGYGPDVLWREIMRAAVAVRHGLPWVASNTDESIPTAYGPAPGHGVLVRTIAEFAGVEPIVAGKPATPLLQETIARVSGLSPVMVGDRLDTDVAGAVALGLPSLLVLTGVTGLDELVSAPADQRPTYLSPTLSGMFEAHPVPRSLDGRHTLGGWSARVVDSRLELEGAGTDTDWWRVVATAAWAHVDATGGEVVRTDGVRPPALAVGGGR